MYVYEIKTGEYNSKSRLYDGWCTKYARSLKRAVEEMNSIKAMYEAGNPDHMWDYNEYLEVDGEQVGYDFNRMSNGAEMVRVVVTKREVL